MLTRNPTRRHSPDRKLIKISFLTNRATSLMVLKNFHPAIVECQAAYALPTAAQPTPFSVSTGARRLSLHLHGTRHAAS